MEGKDLPQFRGDCQLAVVEEVVEWPEPAILQLQLRGGTTILPAVCERDRGAVRHVVQERTQDVDKILEPMSFLPPSFEGLGGYTNEEVAVLGAPPLTIAS